VCRHVRLRGYCPSPSPPPSPCPCSGSCMLATESITPIFFSQHASCIQLVREHSGYFRQWRLQRIAACGVMWEGVGRWILTTTDCDWQSGAMHSQVRVCCRCSTHAPPTMHRAGNADVSTKARTVPRSSVALKTSRALPSAHHPAVRFDRSVQAVSLHLPGG
jgi:hypothetical protein